MACKSNIKADITKLPKVPKIETLSLFEEFLENPGYFAILNRIFGYLDLKGFLPLLSTGFEEFQELRSIKQKILDCLSWILVGKITVYGKETL